MLRNDLITLPAQHDNDNVDGRAVDVEGVVMNNGSIAIVLNGDELQAAHGQQVSKDLRRHLVTPRRTPRYDRNPGPAHWAELPSWRLDPKKPMQTTLKAPIKDVH